MASTTDKGTAGGDLTPEMRDKLKSNFASISQQIEGLQLTHAEWKRLVKSRKELDIIFEDSTRMASVVFYLKVVFILASIVGILLVELFALVAVGLIKTDSYLGAVHYQIAKLYVETYDEANLKEELCIIPFPEMVQDMFRPAVDCSMCTDVMSIDIRVNLSIEEFKLRYAYTSRPLVVTDAMDDWTAMETFSFGYLKGVYGEDSPALESEQDSCQFFPYRTAFEKLSDVFNMTEDEAYLRDKTNAKPWYIGWSNCDSAAANILRKHYKKPYFLPEDSESSKTDWIFMGSPGYGAPNHIDAVDLPSWQAQVKGHKIWTLTPPPECYFECGSRMEVTLHPGYIVIVDTNSWFHSTKVVGDEMSITIGSEYD